ncbi:MAG: glycosyltransferase family 1 protein [Lachnospiraceae bacterium]|nr:glycosyltransferase family 1 protein [Lachnospiraceae bacterium]
MRRILVINTVKFYRQGISSVIMNYYRFLNLDKYHIDFVANEYIDPSFKNEIEERGGKIFVLNRNKTFSYFRNLTAIIKDNKYDIVHVHGNSATMAVELTAAKYAGCSIRIAHSHNTTCMHMKAHRLLKPLFDRMCTEQLACSEDAGKWLFSKKRFTVINNSMDPDNYRFDMVKRSLIRHKLKIDEWELLIGNVGTIEYQKNQEYAINLLHRIKERTEKNTDLRCKLIFLGKGPEENINSLKEEAKRLGISDNVIFYGETDDMQGFLSAMDIFILPSRFEGLPMSLLEAEYAGLPCVASENVTEEAKISDLTYFLPLEDSLDLWADKLIELSEIVLRGTTKISRSKRKMLIKELSDKYDIINSVSKLEQVYDGEIKSEVDTIVLNR